MKKKILSLLLVICMVFGMTNMTTYAAEVGTKENPEMVVADSYWVYTEDGDEDGYYLKYVAEKDGIVNVDVGFAQDEDWNLLDWTCTVNNKEIPHKEDNHEWNRPYENFSVKEGEELLICVNTYDRVSKEQVAGKTLLFVHYYEGTLEDPITGVGDKTYFKLGANESYYVNLSTWDGSTLTVEGEGVAIEYNGSIYTTEDGKIDILLEEPEGNKYANFYFDYKVTNLSDEENQFVVCIEPRLGDYYNPDKDMLGEHIVELNEENNCEYNYCWIAPTDGNFSLEISGTNGWGYGIVNLTQSQNVSGGCTYSQNTQTISVKEGDEIHVDLHAGYFGEFDTPKPTTITVKLSFEEVVSEEPSEPETPEEPSEPSEPEQPSEPEEPSEPETPSEPSEPEVPEVSVKKGWLMENGKWYYYVDGVAKTGWLYDGGAWYYLNSNGTMATGWVYDAGTWYYMKSSGAMATGWLNDGGNWYYLRSSGAMATGWVYDGGVYYYMRSSGAMATGWVNDGGVYYYMKSSGAMATGWLYDGGAWYYLKSSGAMATGWLYDAGTWYYMKSSGAMATGWIQVGGTWYYLYSNGAMASNTWIGSYYVNASGAWVR